MVKICQCPQALYQNVSGCLIPAETPTVLGDSWRGRPPLSWTIGVLKFPPSMWNLQFIMLEHSANKTNFDMNIHEPWVLLIGVHDWILISRLILIPMIPGESHLLYKQQVPLVGVELVTAQLNNSRFAILTWNNPLKNWRNHAAPRETGEYLSIFRGPISSCIKVLMVDPESLRSALRDDSDDLLWNPYISCVLGWPPVGYSCWAVSKLLSFGVSSYSWITSHIGLSVGYPQIHNIYRN